MATKKYATPWDTSFSYVDASGNVLGKGYDSYADAIKKLAFNLGKTQVQELQPTYGGDEWWNNSMNSMLTPGAPGGWTHNTYYTPASTYWDAERGRVDTPETRGPTFATEQELWDYMLNDTSNNLPLSLESREKYGRPIIEGQEQNMFAYLLSNPIGFESVPDWNYHRTAYPGFTGRVSGENALVGSEPVFGNDGKVIGYKVNASPAHLNGADTSGRVTSSDRGATSWNPELSKYAVNLGDGKFFIQAKDVDKLWYDSNGVSTYNKKDNFVEKMMPAVALGALGMGLTGGLTGLFGDAAAAAGTGVGSINPALAESFASMYSPAAWAAPAGAAASATGGTGMFDWIGDAGSWISDLFSSAPEALGEAGGYNFLSNEVIGELPQLLGELGGYGAEGQSLITQALDYVKSNPGSTLKTAIQALGSGGKVSGGLMSALGGYLSGGLQAVGGYLAGNAAQDAAKTSAQAQIEAARIAADAAKFKPVGVTTRFGKSQFTKDAQGNVVSAGYNVSPDIKAMQDSLIGIAPGMLSQFTGSQAATAPMGVGAQRAMSLGNQYLNTDPMAQAKKYYDDQQAIMATGRARDKAGALTDEFNRGTYGLATGATGMMGAANPRLEAMYNAQRQQDLQAAANATQGGMDYAKFGAGLVGTGGNMLRDMYGTQTAAYSPFATAMTGAQNIEGLGQNALDMSVNIGKTASPAQAGSLLGQGMLGAAQTMQQANSYSPWGTALMNAGNAMGTYQNQQAQQQQQNQFLALLTGYKNGIPIG